MSCVKELKIAFLDNDFLKKLSKFGIAFSDKCLSLILKGFRLWPRMLLQKDNNFLKQGIALEN